MLSAKIPKEKTKVIVALKLNKIKNSRVVENLISNYMKTKTDPKNVATYYQLSTLFGIKHLSKEKNIYCWFTTVAETNNLLELDIDMVKKVLQSFRN